MAILVMAYAWLAVDHRALWLWDVTVHESGRYTLQETVFYFSHFLREIPVDVNMALFLVAGFMELREENEPRYSRKISRFARLMLVSAIALIITAFAVETNRRGQQGLNSVMLDLVQFRMRDDLVEYGSHWRFHWLSTLWFGVTAMLAVGLMTQLRRRSNNENRISGNGYQRSNLDHRSSIFRSRIWIVAWAYFVILSIVFWFSGKTFNDVRYTGHQAREIITHGPMTFILSLGVLQLLAMKLSGARSENREDREDLPAGTANRESGSLRPLSGLIAFRSLLIALFILIPVYLAAITLEGDVMEAGQSSRGLPAMVGAHYFEHILDYLLVVLLAVGGSAWMATRLSERQEAK